MERGETGATGARGPRGRSFLRSQVLVYICCFAAIGWTWFSGHESTSKINRERANNIYQGCVRQNAQNSALVGFIEASIPPKRLKDPLVVAYLKRAHKTFPQSDCAEVVRKSVKGG